MFIVRKPAQSETVLIRPASDQELLKYEKSHIYTEEQQNTPDKLFNERLFITCELDD